MFLLEDLQTLCYIQEQVSSSEDYKGNFGYEIHKSESGEGFYLTFKAVLQSFNKMNRNRRYYDLNNIMECINTDPYIQDQLKRNHWQGEIDHPASEYNNMQLTQQRIATPNLEKTSHYIHSPRAEGNLLVANIQTDNGTEAGRNMAIKIVDGKIVPGFSARVFGKLENRMCKPTVMVKRLITYDWVGFPSHDDALGDIKQPLLESAKFTKDMMDTYSGKLIQFDELAQMVMEDSKEASFICESFNLTKEDILGVKDNSVYIKENKNLYVAPITDRTIRNKTNHMIQDWLN